MTVRLYPQWNISHTWQRCIAVLDTAPRIKLRLCKLMETVSHQWVWISGSMLVKAIIHLSKKPSITRKAKQAEWVHLTFQSSSSSAPNTPLIFTSERVATPFGQNVLMWNQRSSTVQMGEGGLTQKMSFNFQSQLMNLLLWNFLFLISC